MSDDSVPEVTPHEAARRLRDGAALLDVRNRDEFDESRVPDSLLIPLGELKERVSELPQDQDLVVICRSGGRSGLAVDWLLSQGFVAVNLSGGILDWEEEGLPVER